MRIPPLDDVIVGTTPLENSIAGVHPHLFATAQRFEELRAKAEQEPWRTMFRAVRGGADAAIAYPSLLSDNPVAS